MVLIFFFSVKEIKSSYFLFALDATFFNNKVSYSKNIHMKASLKLLFIASAIAISSCTYVETTPLGTENFTTASEFYSQNGVPVQTYTINGSTGGSFTSPQGTVVSIPANAFLTLANLPVTGNVTIQIKDIFKKSDMVLSNMPTIDMQGALLKSGGEFFIKAMSDNSPVYLDNSKKITITAPAGLTGGVDSANKQVAYRLILPQDSELKTSRWSPSNEDSVSSVVLNYVYNFYRFSTPLATGSWVNCDNNTYFGKYAKTTLTFMPTDAISNYDPQLYLIFTSVACVVSVYNYENPITCNYAPIGLKCTLVAFSINNKTLYSTFMPITITANQTVNFTLKKTTTSEFKVLLDALN